MLLLLMAKEPLSFIENKNLSQLCKKNFTGGMVPGIEHLPSK
jgi:hypothetical protein